MMTFPESVQVPARSSSSSSSSSEGISSLKTNKADVKTPRTALVPKARGGCKEDNASWIKAPISPFFRLYFYSIVCFFNWVSWLSFWFNCVFIESRRSGVFVWRRYRNKGMRTTRLNENTTLWKQSGVNKNRWLQLKETVNVNIKWAYD